MMIHVVMRCVQGVLLLAALLCARALAQDEHAVIAIRFTGNSTFLASTLSAQMKTHATPKWKMRLLRKKPDLLSDETLKDDLRRLARFYQTEGFLRVRLDPPILKVNADRTVEITIPIHEGEPVRVRRLQHQHTAVTAADSAFAVATLDKLWPLLALQPGVRFRDLSAQDDAGQIRQKFAHAGYVFVEVQSELTVAPEENLVDVLFAVRAGRRCSYGEIRIAGTKYTSHELIHEQLLFKPGGVFNHESLQKSQERLYSLKLFQVVTIRPLLGQAKNDIVPVEIYIKEAPRWTMKFGAGYSLEAYEVLGNEFNFFDGLRFSADLRRMGFLGGARRLGLLAKYSALEPYNFSAEFAQAAFLFPKNTLIVSPYTLKQIDPAYKLSKFGGELILRQQFGLKTSTFVGYNLEQVNQLEETAALSRTAEESSADVYNKSSFAFGFVRDTSLPLFSPRSGELYSAAFKFSGPPPNFFGLDLHSQYHFIKTVLEHRRYLTLKRTTTFAYRLKIGALHSFDANGVIPVEERFFAGGSNSVRGWAYKELGPLADDGTPLGGNSLLEGSGEWRYFLVRWLSGAMFLDFGNVSLMDFDYALKDLRYALGTGLRFETSFGPIRLDVARPIFDDTDEVQFHFNIGQAF